MCVCACVRAACVRVGNYMQFSWSMFIKSARTYLNVYGFMCLCKVRGGHTLVCVFVWVRSCGGM